MPSFPPGANITGGRNAAQVLAEDARIFYAPMIPIVMELHGQGMSLREIAQELQQRDIKTRYGYAEWSAAQVRSVLQRGKLEQSGDPAAEAPAEQAKALPIAIVDLGPAPTTAEPVAEEPAAPAEPVQQPAAKPAKASNKRQQRREAPVVPLGKSGVSDAESAPATPASNAALDPFWASTEYRVLIGAKLQGPYTAEHLGEMLERGEVTLDSRFATSGSTRWGRLRELVPSAPGKRR